MSNSDGSINTTYMQMPNPTPGVTSGPAYAQDIQTSLNIVDAHNHTPGYGQLIPVAGININTTLPINNQIIANTQSINFNTQTTNAVAQSLFFKSTGVGTVDLFAVDGSSNVIRITSGGSVNATTNVLSSGTSSAFFLAGTLVVQANTTGPVPGNVDGASFFFRNQSPNSTFAVELSAPSSLGSNYQLLLPLIPSSDSYMTLNTAGVMSSVSADSIGQHMTSAGANAIAASMNASGISSIALNMSTASANQIINKVSSVNSITAGIVILNALQSDIDGFIAKANSAVTLAGKTLIAANTNTTNRLSMIRGRVSAGGSKISGEGFTSSFDGTDYTLTWTSPFGDTPSVVVTPESNGAAQPGHTLVGSSGATVNFNDTSQQFSFIAMGLSTS